MGKLIFVARDAQNMIVKNVRIDTDEPELIRHQLLHIDGVETVTIHEDDGTPRGSDVVG